ncbi:MAG: Oxidoreductase domain protein [Blastococcus sp.]|jgi:predicted dehydrogenase|nr:Oxidoreductase domain protein [Blastococcus sp.]
MDRIRSGIIGTGFIGGVHAAAVRAAGGVVQAVASTTPEKAQDAAAAWHGEHAAASGLELIERDDVDVVHICTPNSTHAELAHAAIAAGKAVVCEKPLAVDPASASGLVEAAAAAGVVNALPFVYRFYPTVREARDRIARDEAGPLWLLHGSYLQDWLAGRDASNWRVDPALGGASRAFGDIGIHWCDLMEFVTGHRITRLTARWANALAERPAPPDGTNGSTGARVPVATEDGAVVAFETDRGATGSVVVSQVSLGRKNRLWFSFDGLDAAYVFDQELPDSLWVGGLRESHVVPRDPDTLSSPAGRYARLPAGHPQGYQDSFTAFVADVYAAVSGDKPDGLPDFADGLRAARITAAVVESARSGDWVQVATDAATTA